MVQMEWVEGHTLDRHVDELVERRTTGGAGGAGRGRGATWCDGPQRPVRPRRPAARQRAGRRARPAAAGRLRQLVDRARSPAPRRRRETGHRNYQPANRPWGPWMDTFPGLVIYLSLLALAREPDQWATLNDGENLLFRQQDFRSPFNTPTWNAPVEPGGPRARRDGRPAQGVLRAWMGGHRRAGRPARVPRSDRGGNAPRRWSPAPRPHKSPRRDRLRRRRSGGSQGSRPAPRRRGSRRRTGGSRRRHPLPPAVPRLRRHRRSGRASPRSSRWPGSSVRASRCSPRRPTTRTRPRELSSWVSWRSSSPSSWAWRGAK